MVSFGLGHNGDPSPVRLEYQYFLGGHAVAYQSIQALVSVQGIIQLLEVQEKFIEEHLPHCCQLLKNIGFKRGDIRYPD